MTQPILRRPSSTRGSDESNGACAAPSTWYILFRTVAQSDSRGNNAPARNPCPATTLNDHLAESRSLRRPPRSRLPTKRVESFTCRQHVKYCFSAGKGCEDLEPFGPSWFHPLPELQSFSCRVAQQIHIMCFCSFGTHWCLVVLAPSCLSSGRRSDME